MRKIGIMICALVIAMVVFSGPGYAAQTSFDVVVNGGSARMKSSLVSSSNEALPFDATRYSYNAIAVHADGVQMVHNADFEQGYLEVENSMLYIPTSALKVVFVDENLQRVRIAEGADNASLCYDASAGSRVNANYLEYESASIITDSDLVYGVNAVGTGKMMVQTAEVLQLGDVNGSWMSSKSVESVKVRGNAFNLSVGFDSMIPEAPPMSEMPEHGLCAFSQKREL